MIIGIAISLALGGLAAGDPVAASSPVATSPAASAVAAPPSPYKAQAAQPTTVADANKVVCRSEETTGSRLGGLRVCMTNQQWSERGAADRQVLQGQQTRNATH